MNQKLRTLLAAPGAKRAISVARGAAVVLAAYVGVRIFYAEVDEHYPVKEWLFWVYAKIWGYMLLFAAGVFAAGDLTLRALRVRTIPLRERLVFTLAAGVLTFFYGLFAGGLLGLLRPWFAVALPLAFVAGAAPSLVRRGRRVVRHVRAARARGVRPRPWLSPLVAGFGVLGLALVYYGILSPRNVAFDAHFYHLGIAQDYATQHAIRPFREGWLPGALPHLASVLYTWAFTLPGLDDMFGRIVCAAHVEFVLFGFTLASIPVLVRYLVPRAHVATSWAAMFLFPGILVYDSSLTAAADHVAAFWAIPSWLAFRRAFVTFSPRAHALAALCLAGAVLTKYQAMYILAFPVLALSAKAAYLLLARAWDRLKRKQPVPRRAWLEPVVGLGAAAGAGAAFTSAHWLKNWVFYDNPLFPYLSGVFPSTRWVPETPRLFQDWSTWQTKRWVTEGDTWTKVKEAAEATLNFSFVPHDWPNFHGKVPVFGSLFTLSLLVLPFLKGTRRTWALSAAGHLGVFVWFYTMHQDRYLQVLVPWMAAVVAATIALAWRSGIPGRVAVASLVGFQIIWGSDAYLIPSHAMTKAAPITTSNDLVSMGYRKKYEQRFKAGGALFDLGANEALPKDARILVHENNPRLGLWRPVVADIAGWQYALRYELLSSPAAVHDALVQLGVTHIVTRRKKSRGFDSLGADLRFFDFVEQEAEPLARAGEFHLLALPKARPSGETATGVAYLGCGKLYERGLYELSDLAIRDKQVAQPKRPRARMKGSHAELLAEASFAVTDPKCKDKVPAGALAEFLKLGVRGREELWSRKRAPGASPLPVEAPIPSESADEDDDDPIR